MSGRVYFAAPPVAQGNDPVAVLDELFRLRGQRDVAQSAFRRALAEYREDRFPGHWVDVNCGVIEHEHTRTAVEPLADDHFLLASAAELPDDDVRLGGHTSSSPIRPRTVERAALLLCQ